MKDPDAVAYGVEHMPDLVKLSINNIKKYRLFKIII